MKFDAMVYKKNNNKMIKYIRSQLLRSLSLGFLSLIIVLSGILNLPLSAVYAAPRDYQQEAEGRKLLPIETNEIPGWPEGPAIGAESAILMDAETGIILYAKNIHEKLYPASVTKILTTLIASEECELNEVVTFSHDAIFSIPYDSSHIAIDVNEQLTVDQCLQAILIASANEVANGLAEHVAGSMDAFTEMMNQKARELGCLNSNFVTTNGLHDDNHYTTAYDLAMIGRHFFANELLCKYASTSRLHIPPSDHQPDDIVAWCKNELYEGRPHEYEYLVASKTGYTDTSRQTLVSCAEKDGMKLICVILKEESPAQYTDTIDLFNYGFSNFQKINVAQAETRFNIDNASFFYSNNDIFGDSKPLLSINPDAAIILPKTAEFSDAESVISYDNAPEGTIGTVTYNYNGTFIGSATIDLAVSTTPGYQFTHESSGEMAESLTEQTIVTDEDTVIFLNVKKILLFIIGGAAIIILIIFIFSSTRNYQFGGRSYRRRRRRSPRRRRGSKGRRRDLHF